VGGVWSLNNPSGVSSRIKPVNPAAALPINLNAFNAHYLASNVTASNGEFMNKQSVLMKPPINDNRKYSL